MKKFLFSILSCLILSVSDAQVPNQINYQGIARNSVGNVLPNQPITVRLTVRDGSVSGTVLFMETRNVTTNAFGLFFYGIGSPGATTTTGTLGAVNWPTGNKFLQVEIDPKGGTSFTDAGTTQLLSVPYALYAAGAPPTGNAGGSLIGTYPNPTIANGVVTLPMMAPGVIPTTLPPSGPAGGSLTGTYPNPLIANGAITQLMLGPGITLPPNGPAGGSLTGNYPNPTIANGVVTLAMMAPGVIPTNLPPNGPAGGDLSGTYPNPTVSKILGRTLSNTVPVMNDVLSYNGTTWSPVSLSSISTSVWSINGNHIYNSNSGNVGIGINNLLLAKLHVFSSGTYGILGDANGTGVYGRGGQYGVQGFSTSGTGVLGYGATYYGVEGNGPTGVYGTGTNFGVVGYSANEIGVEGVGGHTGVYGTGDDYGVRGHSINYLGVYGTSNTNTGVFGQGIYGVQGLGSSYGVSGSSNNGSGVYGTSTNFVAGYFLSANGDGIYAKTNRSDNNYAGLFDGNVYTYNTYITSDKNLKKNIEDLNDAMGVLMQLKPRTYEFRDDGKLINMGLPKGKHYGVLAQDLEAVLPNLVKDVENEVSPPPVLEKDGIPKQVTLATSEKIKTKAVNYTELIPIMIKGIQEQQAVINSQKEKIETLEARLAKLESLLSTSTKK